MPLPQRSVDLQSAAQPSPSTVFPSSHTSPAIASGMPLPHFSFDLQSASQPSPSTMLPSSHTSPGSSWPLPQSLRMQTSWFFAHWVPAGQTRSESGQGTLAGARHAPSGSTAIETTAISESREFFIDVL